MGDGIDSYAPAGEAADAVVVRVHDADGDGRPDLVTQLPHAHLVNVAHEFSDHEYRGGPSTLWHSLPDGTFSRSDALAVPPQNVTLFRKYEEEIEKYAMHGLAVLGL